VGRVHSALTSGLPRGVRDTICYKIVFEVTDDEVWVVAVQFVSAILLISRRRQREEPSIEASIAWSMQSSFRAGEGSVTDVEVFQMAGLARNRHHRNTSTPIPGTDARPRYTVNREEPLSPVNGCPAPTGHRYCIATRAIVLARVCGRGL
jgi:hypothetical protein